MDDGLEDVLDSEARLRAGQDGFAGRNGQDVLELFFDRGDVRIRQVDLVDHRDDGEPLFVGQMHGGNGLRLDPLCGVDNHEGSLAGSEGAGDFVGEIHVAWCVEQVEFVFLAIFRHVAHGHGVHLDRDPALALEVHRIEQLVLLLSLGNGARHFEQAIGQCGLTVVDVGDDAKVARVPHGVEPASILDPRSAVKRRVVFRGLPAAAHSVMVGE